MIEAEKRKAIFILHQEGLSDYELAGLFRVSRNTVREIVKQQGDMPTSVRSDKKEIDEELLRRLYTECNGYAERVYEKLVEEECIEVGYSTVTRMLRELGISVPEKQRCDEVPDQPGAEMQHDTSPYVVKLGERQVGVIASLLYLRYSKRRYLKFYRAFNRFKMKCFFHEALMFWQYSAPLCVIDNTNLARLRGIGKNAVMVKEMAEFGKRYAMAAKQRFSHGRLLEHVIKEEFELKRRNAHSLRLKKAKIPERFVIETFPFDRQPKLNKKRILALYDAFEYMSRKQNIIWLGPTGCGKTGLATSFLIHAIDRGYTGRYVTFAELIAELYRSVADHSEAKVIKQYLAYDCLQIDEIGYVEVEPVQVGLFFSLMQKRHKAKTTLITSNLGFSEWGNFLKNDHLTAALIDRLTEVSHVINMKNCRSIRPPLEKSPK